MTASPSALPASADTAASRSFELRAGLDRLAPKLLRAAVLLYIVVELLYVLRMPLVMDELHGAAQLERLRTSVPYRDYFPYKTILGYLLQLPFYSLPLEAWDRLLAVKLATAGAVAACAVYTAKRLGLLYGAGPAVLATALLLCTTTFLERSAVLRVDPPTALLGWLSLVALLEGRATRAGALAGISFLVSQKGIYYIGAGGLALGTAALVDAARTRDWRSLAPAARFGATAAIPTLLYLGMFALVAPWERIGNGVFARAVAVAADANFEIHGFWLQTLRRNPLFYALALIGLGLAWHRAASSRAAEPDGRRALLLAIYSSVLAAVVVWHHQPWPYFFVLVLPTASVLVGSGLARLLDSTPRPVLVAGAAAVLIGGFAFPLSRVPEGLARDNGFQRHMFAIADRVLGPDDAYLAGLRFLPQRRHARGGLTWLDAARRQVIDRGGPEASAKSLAGLDGDRVKLVIWNYRLAKLPEPLRAYLADQFAPLFGNLHIYSPRLAPGASRLDLRFAGRYALSGPAGSTLEIAQHGSSLEPEDEVRLAAGPSELLASHEGMRLHLVPDDIEAQLDARYATARPLFPAPYTW